MLTPSPKSFASARRAMLMGALAGAMLALAFVAGLLARDVLLPTGAPLLAADASSPGDYALLSEVQRLLDQHYLRAQPNTQQRAYGAVRGMLDTLDDRFTSFIEPQTAQSEADVLSGTYGGIGVLTRRTEQGDVVLYPLDDSPAARADVREGDVLVAIDDEPLAIDLPIDAVDQRLRGRVAPDSGVTLTLARPGEDAVRTQFVAFDVINIPSVVWRVVDDAPDVGVVQVLRFTGRTPDELAEALDALQQQDVTALVLDLRNNSGGLLQESLAVAGQFLDGDVVVYERTTRGEQAFRAPSGGVAADIPLMVLVNEGTASAAEIVAGALRDNGRALVIGQRTYGKGTVQQIFRLSDGSSVHITSSEWFTPARTPLEAQGLTPDITMIPDPSGRDVELGEALRQLATR